MREFQVGDVRREDGEVYICTGVDEPGGIRSRWEARDEVSDAYMRRAIVQLVSKVQDAVVGMGVRPDDSHWFASCAGET